jgi:hypothetical protein
MNSNFQVDLSFLKMKILMCDPHFELTIEGTKVQIVAQIYWTLTSLNTTSKNSSTNKVVVACKYI